LLLSARRFDAIATQNSFVWMAIRDMIAIAL
jgi:hypothetical protein